jgi:hypothetical protein
MFGLIVVGVVMACIAVALVIAGLRSMRQPVVTIDCSDAFSNGASLPDALKSHRSR